MDLNGKGNKSKSCPICNEILKENHYEKAKFTKDIFLHLNHQKSTRNRKIIAAGCMKKKAGSIAVT